MRKLFVTLGLVLVACGGSKSSGFGEDNDAGGGTGGDGGGGGGTFVDGGMDTGGGNEDCSEAAKLVYVITQSNDLYSFYPATLTFKKIGTLSCPAPGMNSLGMTAQPNSMAVDRGGTAWVNFDSGKLFKVSTADATCSGTSFAPMQSNFVKFGMGFASNSAGSKDESLYVVGIDDGLLGVSGLGLAKIDLGSMKLTTIGDFTDGLEMQGAELTGTGAGNLYGFFTSSPATLSPIDKGSAATPMANQKVLNGVDTGIAWAFSFWGGDFWYYTAASGQTTDVTQQKASGDNSVGVVKSQIGFRIVGAGVSTCAPLTPPK